MVNPFLFIDGRQADQAGLGDEVFLSFLPLSHSYEHSCGLMFPVSIGAATVGILSLLASVVLVAAAGSEPAAATR